MQLIFSFYQIEFNVKYFKRVAAYLLWSLRESIRLFREILKRFVP